MMHPGSRTMLTELSVYVIYMYLFIVICPGKDTMKFQALVLRVEMFLSFGMS